MDSWLDLRLGPPVEKAALAAGDRPIVRGKRAGLTGVEVDVNKSSRKEESETKLKRARVEHLTLLDKQANDDETGGSMHDKEQGKTGSTDRAGAQKTRKLRRLLSQEKANKAIATKLLELVKLKVVTGKKEKDGDAEDPVERVTAAKDKIANRDTTDKSEEDADADEKDARIKLRAENVRRLKERLSRRGRGRPRKSADEEPAAPDEQGWFM
jgi:hypothetical protein